MFDFDSQLSLADAPSSKHNAIGKVYGVDHPDMIAMWVADMDFAAAPPIVEALRRDVERGYYGYFGDTSAVSAAVQRWLRDKHDWEIDPRTVTYTHGVISGYGDAIQAFSDPGDGVIVFSPVYHAFYRQIQAMGRTVVESEMRLRDGRYVMDLEALASQLTGREKLVTFCSPHNPGGRLWERDEIRALAEFCEAHDLILISDEIHMDLVFPGQKFVPTLVAAPEAVSRTVVLTAASKGFNLAGAETGMMIVPDEALRKKTAPVVLDRESSPNRFGMVMLKAAFTECDTWSEACRMRIAANAALFEERMNALPGVNTMAMQATYLSWVDFNALGMSDQELMDRLLNKARVVPSPGPQFGSGGSGHLRFNLALPEDRLIEAIGRIEDAFADLQ